MRFALALLVITLFTWTAHAKPGERITPESDWPRTDAIKRQVRSADTPVAPDGFKVRKIVSNLGNIVSVVSIGDDIFVADADQDRILRLKSRSDGSAFETRAEYLVGFDRITDLAADDKHLFMSDKNGIWKIEVGVALAATQPPVRIYAHPSPQSGTTISISTFPNKNELAVGVGNGVFSLNTMTGNSQPVSKGTWEVKDIAVSPTGNIWASVMDNGTNYIMPIRTGINNPARLTLPHQTRVTDIQFWQKDEYPENWPEQWLNDMLVSLDGGRPMLARAHFNFGDLESDFTVLVDGFSKASRIVGRREYWGVPAAMAILGNGQLIFAEAEQGALWALEKLPETELEAEIETKPDIDVGVPIEKDIKPARPDILRGSSLTSASGLETDELLKAPEKTTISKEE